MFVMRVVGNVWNTDIKACVNYPLQRQCLQRPCMEAWQYTLVRPLYIRRGIGITQV